MATILVFSTDQDNKALICLLVQHDGHQFIQIQSLKEVLQASNCDLLIIDGTSWLTEEDWKMLDKLNSSIPVIATNVFHFDVDEIKENKNIDIAITSPWGPNELLGSISELLKI
jgi:hypothetical protein